MTRTAALRTAVAAVALAAALALAGCGGGTGPTPTPTPTTASPTPTATPTPTSTPTSDPTPTTVPANLPTDCSTLATPDVRAAAIGDLTLQSDGSDFVRPAPDGATLALGCDWIVGDSTGMLLLISTATTDAVTAAVATLPGLGYSCQTSDDFGAQFCDKPGTNGLPDTEEMIVARDDVWIYLSTSNRNGRAFLSDIVQGIFG